MELKECPYCHSKHVEWLEGGKFKGERWDAYECMNCKTIISDEPDWDDLIIKAINTKW